MAAIRPLVCILFAFLLSFMPSANGSRLLSQVVSGDKFAADQERARSKEIERHGRELRKAFDAQYDTLPKPLKLGPFGGVDASAVIQNYIPPGMAFDDAEALLRSAGFSVRARPGEEERNNINRPSDWFAVTANIDFYRRLLPGRVDLSAMLFPRAEGDYTVVSKSTAAFIFSFP